MKITAGVVPFASVLNCDSVVTSCPAAAPPPVVPPFSDAQPTGVGAPAMNDGTEQGVAACVASDSSGSSIGSGAAQPTAKQTGTMRMEPYLDLVADIGLSFRREGRLVAGTQIGRAQ